ncbi:MAG: glycosyltransferase [Deltaproteobacteria bacterium]|nr:glycosyltransferase [Deltaproteobacteria bacterium]
MPRVSVIIPAYNCEKTVSRCLESLLQQDYPKDLYEIIAVDDGSKDGSADVIKRYRVHYLWQVNKGPATARNKGVEKAAGDIVLFTDSDCVPDRGWIREMVRPFEDKGVAAVKGAYRTEQKGVVARFSQLEFEERFEMLKKAASIDMVDTYSAGFRKEIFTKMGGFDTSFPVANNEDTELSYRMSGLGYRMVFNPQAIVSHLNHPASVRRYSKIKFWRGYWRMVVYKRFPDKMLKDTYTPQTLKFQILFLLLMAASVPAAFVIRPWGACALGLFALFFLATSMPFLKLSLKRDPAITILVPALLFMRAASIGTGAIWGVIKR